MTFLSVLESESEGVQDRKRNSVNIVIFVLSEKFVDVDHSIMCHHIKLQKKDQVSFYVKNMLM